MEKKSSTTLPQVYQLLRLHIASARFNNNAPDCWKTFCAVKVGDKCAQTLDHPLLGSGSGSSSGSGTKEVQWNEGFIIEFDYTNSKLFLEVQVFSGKDLLGATKLKVDNLKHGSADELWDKVMPNDFPLCDAKGKNVGTIALRIRHEFKVFGTLVVELEDGDLAESASSPNSVMAIVKHVDQVFPSSSATVNDNHFSFGGWSKSFDINEKNNVFDIFIELWANHPATTELSAALEPAPTAPIPEKKEALDPRVRESMLGQARLALFDARSSFHSTLPIFTPDQKKMGQLRVHANLVAPGKRFNESATTTTEKVQSHQPIPTSH